MASIKVGQRSGNRAVVGIVAGFCQGPSRCSGLHEVHWPSRSLGHQAHFVSTALSTASLLLLDRVFRLPIDWFVADKV